MDALLSWGSLNGASNSMCHSIPRWAGAPDLDGWKSLNVSTSYYAG